MTGPARPGEGRCSADAIPNRLYGIQCSYCGSLDWTIHNYGRVTHKVACPHRTEPWSQQEPHADSAEFNRRPLADATRNRVQERLKWWRTDLAYKAPELIDGHYVWTLLNDLDRAADV